MTSIIRYDEKKLRAVAPLLATTLVRASEFLEGYLQKWEGNPGPGEIETKHFVVKIAEVLALAGIEQQDLTDCDWRRPRSTDT